MGSLPEEDFQKLESDIMSALEEGMRRWEAPGGDEGGQNDQQITCLSNEIRPDAEPSSSCGRKPVRNSQRRGVDSARAGWGQRAPVPSTNSRMA